MNNIIKNKLISAIYEFTPKGLNTADLIANILDITKESAYRRLRGEINISFDEIARIANYLKFSIDAVIGARQKSNLLLNLQLENDSNSFDILISKLQTNIDFLQELKKSKKMITVRMAQNELPLYIIFKHRMLSKFYVYKWCYQNTKGSLTSPLSEFEIPKSLSKLMQNYIIEIQSISRFILILDPNVYESSIFDIEYFCQLDNINKEESLMIKNDLFSSINTLEDIATEGKSGAGSIVEMYISAVDIDASYHHIETDVDSFSIFPVFCPHTLDSGDKRLGDIQKGWIESLKKQSVYISQCGEIERYKFFNKQRDLINRDLQADIIQIQ